MAIVTFHVTISNFEYFKKLRKQFEWFQTVVIFIKIILKVLIQIMMLSNFVIGIKLYNWLQLEIKNGFLEVTHIHGLESKLEIKFKTLEDFKNIFECKHIKKELML